MGSIAGLKKFLTDNQLEFHFEDGMIMLNANLEEGRSQGALIRFEDNDESLLGPGFSVRSFAMRGNGQLSAEIANKLLNQNFFLNNMCYGTWAIAESESGETIVSLTARLPESLQYPDIVKVVIAICRIADMTEEEHMSSDEL